MCNPLSLRSALALALLATPHLAQGDRPGYSFLRWNEDWSVLHDATGDEHLFDPLKYVALSDDGETWISFGGDLRFRAEDWHSFRAGMAPAGIDTDDTFYLGRVRLHADLHLTQDVRVFGEVKSALASDRDLVGGARRIDEDVFALQQLFVDAPLFGGSRLRVGRQQLSFGKQRLISPLPWANALRTWDGVLAVFDLAPWKVSTFATAFVPAKARVPNDPDTDRLFFGAYAEQRGASGAKNAGGTDLYLLRSQNGNTMFNGTRGDDDRWTLGLRRFGASPDLDWEIELGYQFGDLGSGDVSAWSFASQLGHTTVEAVRLWTGLDWASGDRNAGGNVQTFNQLYPLGHAYFGIADAIGRQNVVDASLGATWKATSELSLSLGNHQFWADSSNDAIYDAGGNPWRAGGTYSSSRIGFETDLTATWRPQQHVRVDVGYARLFAGDALDESGSGEDIDFGFAGVTFTF